MPEHYDTQNLKQITIETKIKMRQQKRDATNAFVSAVNKKKNPTASDDEEKNEGDEEED